MADRPTSSPRWADSGGTIKTPPSGKLDVGFTKGERPPAPFLNWLLNLIYQWINWISVGHLTRAGVDDASPVFATTDTEGNIRSYLDPNGYVFGPVISHQYEFPLGPGVVAGQTDVIFDTGRKLMVSTDTATTVAITSVSATRSVNSCQLRAQNAAVSQAARLYTRNDNGAGGQCIGDIDNVVAVLEYRAELTAVGANNVQVHGGFSQDPEANHLNATDPAQESFVLFQKASADTNWQCRVGNSTAGTTTSSGVPPVVNVAQTFRIEYHGLNTPLGVDNTFATARFFIDGVQVAEIGDTNVPIDPEAIFGVTWRNRADGTGPVADLDFTIGLVKLAWNTQMTPTPPV